MGRVLNSLALALGMTVGTNALAEGFVGVPTGWKLESYGAAYVVLWHTPTPCSNGMLTLNSTSTLTEHNRLYATVMAAKMANAQMFVYYEQKGEACVIVSFGLV